MKEFFERLNERKLVQWAIDNTFYISQNLLIVRPGNPIVILKKAEAPPRPRSSR
jgi:hypothetical protein